MDAGNTHINPPMCLQYVHIDTHSHVLEQIEVANGKGTIQRMPSPGLCLDYRICFRRWSSAPDEGGKGIRALRKVSVKHWSKMVGSGLVKKSISLDNSWQTLKVNLFMMWKERQELFSFILYVFFFKDSGGTLKDRTDLTLSIQSCVRVCY